MLLSSRLRALFSDSSTLPVTEQVDLLATAVRDADHRFQRCVAIVLEHEGGYVDNPADPGGATKHGISLRYARTRGSMFDLDGDGDVDKADILLVTPDFAAQVYRDWFWSDVRGDDLPAGIDLCLFDYAVNSGASRAIKLAQGMAGVAVDGYIGPQTISALQRIASDNERRRSFITHYNDNRLQWLRTLRTWPDFGNGWTARVNKTRDAALRMVNA